MKKTNNGSLVCGILLLIIGVILAGNIGNYWSIDVPYLLFYQGFWTFFIILPCIFHIMQNGFQVASVTAIVVSGLIFIAKMGYFDLAFAKRMILPVLLSIIGISFYTHCFLSAQTEDANTDDDENAPTEDAVYEAAFGSRAITYDNLHFAGCSLSATFGEARLDLSHAEFPEHATHIDCSALFGTLDIHIPEKANIMVKGTPIFGGIHNYRKGNATIDDAPTIYIDVTCIFGGVDIR